ncbi:terminase large subunit [Bremerella sp. JC770]|uniref:terminase large subunit domain-containing protein n=1 Tax=Bremerella sp. JC770 TaxID=3232137 RepID=UPI00345A6D19
MIERDGMSMPLADALEDWQRADFEALDLSWIRVCGGPSQGPQGAWLERPRGHSKTSDIAAQVAYALLASPMPIRGIAAAASKDQARILRDSVLKLKRLNPELLGILTVNLYAIKNDQTGSELQILSADADTSFGAQPDFVIADEVSHWPDLEGQSLWGSLFSASAKNAHCLLLAITNAGSTDSWQYATREGLRLESSWYFHSLDGIQASWLDEQRLEQQERLLPPILYRRYWRNEWTGSSQTAFTPEQIAQALEAGKSEFLGLPSVDQAATSIGRGMVFFGALDLGVRQDFSALAIVSKHVGYQEFIEKPVALSRIQQALIDLGEIEPPEPEYEQEGEEGTGKLRLVHLQIWRPSQGVHVDLTAVERAILEAHSKFNLSALWSDPSQAEFLGQRLRKAGVPFESRDQTINSLHDQAITTLGSFRDGEVELPELEELPALLEDLERAQIEARQTKVRLRSPRIAGEGHGDALTSFSIAVTAAKFSPSGRLPTIPTDQDLITVI